MAAVESPAEIAEFGPPTLASLENVWVVWQATAAFNYACVTIMLWDMLLTMKMEVHLLWRTKFSILKTTFLVNRYVAPTVICVNIYFFSGQASGITNGLCVLKCRLRLTTTDTTSHSCRAWLPVAVVVQTLCLGSVSFLFAFRLWAWYEVSARALYALLLVWATSLITTLGFVINLAGFHAQDIVDEPYLNICISVVPTVWLLYLPATVEHGIYAVFLLFNAMATPRSERKAALAIIYRDGIHFYILTFSVCLIALLIWRVAPRPYEGFGLFPPWMVFQVGISRLLLNVRSSQLFAAQEPGTAEDRSYLGPEIPLREVMSQHEHEQEHERDTDRASCGVTAADEEAKTESPFRTECDGMEWPNSGGGGHGKSIDTDSARREIRRIHPKAGGSAFMRRFWWMHRSEIADIHVDIMHADDNQGDESGETSTGGVKLSRLGRLDEWL